MDNIIDISQKIDEKRQKKSMKKLDIAASYVCLEKCLKYLEMNKLQELENLKKEIKKTMKKLMELSK